ncbi:MAG: trigger factor [Christensenellaceae bacterium]|nr:trigger factor [Christensenellaceae bacterium]
MSATVEKISSNQVKLTITVPAADFSAAMSKAYLRVRGRLTVPGFRKGKAPRKVIENYYGQGILMEEAFNAIVPSAYDSAVTELDLNPVAQPDIDISSFGENEDCIFTATVYVRPEVTLGQYKGIEAPEIEVSVSDDELSAELEAARERVARWLDAERPAKQDDRVNIDYLGTVDGEPFEGGKSENFPLVLGSGTFIPGFEEQIIGMQKGEEKDIAVTFPEDYRATELAGKDASFHVILREIKEKELPDLDDEFASEVSEFETLEEYRADIRGKLEEQAKTRAENERGDQIVAKVVENATVNVPEPMIDAQVHNMIDEMAMRMSYQGLRMQDFLQYTGQTEHDLHEQYEEPAKQRVLTELVLDAVRKAEGIEASDEEVAAEIEKYAAQIERPSEEIKAEFGENEMNYFRDLVLSQKTIAFLSEHAVPASKSEEPAAE